MLIAKYTCNASGVVPAFNSGYVYEVNEVESEGIYTVEITSENDFSSCSFSGKNQLLTVEYLKVTSKVTTMYSMFFNCSRLTSIDLSNWDISEVTTMHQMFYGCANLTSLNLSNFDASKVTNMSYMFYNCINLTSLDLSNFNAKNVTNMYATFANCNSLTSLDISNFNASNVTNMDSTFYNCQSLTSLDLSNFNTSNVTTMHNMFSGCTNLTSLDLSSFDTSKVTDMISIFYKCNNLSYFNLDNCSELTATSLINNIPTKTEQTKGKIITKSITDEITTLANNKFWELISGYLMAKYTCNASGIIPTFNNGYVYEVNETENEGIYTVEITSESDFGSCNFSGKSQLLTVEYLKVTSNVTSMHQMFSNCKKLTSLNVSNWDTSNVTTMFQMFISCNNLTSLDVSNFDTSKVNSMHQMFTNCNNLTSLDVSNFDTSKVTAMSNMFYNCNKLTSLDVSNWDTSNVTTMYAMFTNCNNLTSLDVSNWDTSNVTDMSYMFNGYNKLTSLDLSNFNTSKVTNMYSMFDGCKNLTSLDVSNFNTSKVTNMANMFYNCSNLTQLNLSNWNTSSVNNMVNMFYNCNKLTSLDLSNFNTSEVTNMGYMFNGCTNLTIIGLIYANIDTLNKLPTSSISTLYIDTNIDQTTYTGSSKLKVYEQRTVTINIPTALRSNEEIADRIYWNDEDKHYYIEQNINPNTNETLENPNIIASGVKQPIYLKTYENILSVGIQNIDPSYMSINVPFFEIPTDYEYKWEDELDYIKQSFELRFPDEDDVEEGWGFMGCDNEEGTGLKALIDWVDNCTDEEFVADFDKHFLKDYTLRYYCLVILIGAVDRENCPL